MSHVMKQTWKYMAQSNGGGQLVLNATSSKRNCNDMDIDKGKTSSDCVEKKRKAMGNQEKIAMKLNQIIVFDCMFLLKKNQSKGSNNSFLVKRTFLNT